MAEDRSQMTDAIRLRPQPFVQVPDAERQRTSVFCPLPSDIWILRKEVIQPQVPLRLPCYDFTPVADLTVVGCPPGLRKDQG